MSEILRAIPISAQKLEELKDFLGRRGVIAAYLFGSRARGEHSDESDVDLALLFPVGGFSFELYVDFYDALADLFYPLQLDLVILNQAPLDLAFEIIAEGSLLFCSSDEMCTDYEDRLIRDYLDFSVELELYYREVREEITRRAQEAEKAEKAAGAEGQHG